MYNGCQPYRPLAQLKLEEYERVSEEYRLYKQCAHCNQRFRQAENIGQYQCRLHPGVLTYDLYRHGDFYSCCGGAGDSVGCRAADHMSRSLELDEDDQNRRHEQLFEQAFSVVPCGLFGYGLMPPTRAATLWQSFSSGAEKARSSCFATSFNPALQERFVHRDVAHEVSESVKDSAVLLRTLASEGVGAGVDPDAPPRSQSLRRIEEGWRSSLDRVEAMDEEEEEETRRRTTRPDYNLPYLIVSRIS